MRAVGRVQARGQVTLPRELREATGIAPGADLLFLPLGPGRFEARVVPARRRVRELLAAFAVPGQAPPPQAIAVAVEEGMAAEAAAGLPIGEAEQ